ncbi:ABC transporter substrate-binding protein [Bacillus salitolerans]|uniref:ABC transporter substrate-binding protein n=1 Tax=Bacillus salitolerans TaxID=1437434 RepID=A0ABW4LUS4_9BACI
MNILTHYIQLFNGIAPSINKKIEISIKEISQLLYCTDRNSNLVIAKLVEQGWIDWLPGRGRGNRSRIVFRKNPTNLVIQRCKEFVKAGEIKEARKMISEHEGDVDSLRKQFDQWFESLFGFHVESVEEEKVDLLRLKVQFNLLASLDPLHAHLRSECHIVKQVCDTLVRYNKQTREIEPHLAFYWEHDQECKNWSFFLRKGIRFHNGETLTAHDVVYSLIRVKRTDNAYKWMMKTMSSIKAINEGEVAISFSKPYPFLLQILCDERLSIVPDGFDIETLLIGTGPFYLSQLNEFVIQLNAHSHYFKGRPYLDVVELWNVEEGRQDDDKPHDVRFGLLQKEEETSDRKQSRVLEWNVQYLTLNCKKTGPLQSIKLRQALTIMLDRQKLISELGGPREEIAHGFLRDSLKFEIVSQSVQQLLAESGYNGEVLHLYTFTDEDHQEDVTWIQQQCGKYGVHIESHYVEATELLQAETLEKADILHDSASLDEEIERNFLHIILARNSFIFCHMREEMKLYMEKSLDHLFEADSEEVRLTILKEIEKKLLDVCQVIPLYRNQARVHSDSMVQEATLNAQGWLDFYHIWFRRDRGVKS